MALNIPCRSLASGLCNLTPLRTNVSSAVAVRFLRSHVELKPRTGNIAAQWTYGGATNVTGPFVEQRRLKHASKKAKTRKGQKTSDDEADFQSIDDIAGVQDTKTRFDRVLEGLKHDLHTLRGGKTDPGMLDSVKVDSYGTSASLASVAQASMKGPQLIVLTVYDPSMTNAVEDAVRECGMGLNPSSEGQGQVNVPIPKPTKESREAMAKVAAKHAEKTKVVLRGIRHKIQDQIKKHKDSFPEDEVHQRLKEIDKCTQDAEASAGKMLDKRKTEILTV